MKDRRVHRVVTVCVLAAMAAGIAGGSLRQPPVPME